MRTGAPVQWEYLPVLPSNSSCGFERRVYGSNTAEFVNSKYHQKFLSNHHHFYAKSPFSQNLPSLGKSPISRIANLAHLYNMAQVRLTLAQSYFSRNYSPSSISFIWLSLINRPTRADPIVTRDQCLTLANFYARLSGVAANIYFLELPRLDCVASLTIRIFHLTL